VLGLLAGKFLTAGLNLVYNSQFTNITTFISPKKRFVLQLFQENLPFLRPFGVIKPAKNDK
jgi:hypothetical protein